jgi:hypothetical protein
MTEPLTLEDLTKLVRERLDALGHGEVRFAIRPLPFELPNWDIDPQSSKLLRATERNALFAVGRKLREKHRLALSNVLSPYAA